MSQLYRHIKSQQTYHEGPYATIQEPTITTFISKEVMERNEKKESVRQESEVIYDESRLVKNKETKG